MSLSRIRKGVAPALALVLLAAALTLATSTAGGQEHEADLRIAARRLDGGQLEVALQQRTDDSWG